MKGLFDYDSGFFRALDKLGSLFILNLITLVCSIPFVTVGAAFTALYYVTMKMVKDEETYILKDYFRSFRQNFVQATVIWLIFFVAGSIMYFDYRIASTYRESFPAAGAFTVLVMACGLFYIMALAYVFPVLAKFYNSTVQTLKNALIMSIRHFPLTLAIVCINVIFPVITVIGMIKNGRSLLAPLYICLGFAVPAYANSYLFIRLFASYIPADEGAETGPDEEYVTAAQDVALTEGADRATGITDESKKEQ